MNPYSLARSKASSGSLSDVLHVPSTCFSPDEQRGPVIAYRLIPQTFIIDGECSIGAPSRVKENQIQMSFLIILKQYKVIPLRGRQLNIAGKVQSLRTGDRSLAHRGSHATYTPCCQLDMRSPWVKLAL